jgi:hypothetical protein
MRWIAAAVIFTLVLGPARAFAATSGQAGEIDPGSAYYTGAAGAPAVQNQNPRPGSLLRTYFPQFFATIVTHGGAPLRRESLHLSVDGTDVTGGASITANSVSYTPRTRISAGWHDVFLQGADTSGRAFSEAWAFQSEAPDGVNITSPGSGLQVVASGDERDGGFTHLFFTSPSDGSALLQLCGFPALAFVHIRLSPVFFITVPFQFAGGFEPFGGCAPQVLFSPFGGFGSIFIPLQIGAAGPGFFHHHHHHHWPRSTMPVVRNAEPSLPVVGGAVPGSVRSIPVMAMPRVTMPRVTMPQVRMPAVSVPRVTVPHLTVPHISVPHPAAQQHPR